ncbi:putative major capsid protein [Faustovirus]|nr:putative major capsid protein [Faustovirus]AMN83126.1 putative major capsid protein [Faustovirus]AMN84106.1 putative major capsid protein [Faustovirus]AMN85095.1 putative major capsid protein [Faustovirus]
MSAGGVFKLIANDGKADRMIMANDLLNDRIKSIMCLRAKQGFSDPTPTLVF